MKNKIKVWLAIAAIIIITFWIAFNISKWTTPTSGVLNKDYEITRLQKEIKYNNNKYLGMALANDSLKSINYTIQLNLTASNERTGYYYTLYSTLKRSLNRRLENDSIFIEPIHADSIIGITDKIIQAQKNEITWLQAVNTNNDLIIENINQQLQDTDWLVNSCNDLLVVCQARNEKLLKKLEKVKNKRNVWIGIGIAEAVLLTLIIVFGTS